MATQSRKRVCTGASPKEAAPACNNGANEGSLTVECMMCTAVALLVWVGKQLGEKEEALVTKDYEWKEFEAGATALATNESLVRERCAKIGQRVLMVERVMWAATLASVSDHSPFDEGVLLKGMHSRVCPSDQETVFKGLSPVQGVVVLLVDLALTAARLSLGGDVGLCRTSLSSAAIYVEVMRLREKHYTRLRNTAVSTWLMHWVGPDMARFKSYTSYPVNNGVIPFHTKALDDLNETGCRKSHRCDFPGECTATCSGLGEPIRKNTAWFNEF